MLFLVIGCVPKQKRPITYMLGNPALFLSSSLIAAFRLKDTHFVTAIIGFLFLIIAFLLTRGREKVNNNELFWEIKNLVYEWGLMKKIP